MYSSTEPPDRERVIVLFGPGPLEMKQRGLILAAVVQQVGEIDARLAEARVELERAPQPMQAAAFVRQPVRRLPYARRRIGGVGVRAQRPLKEAARLVEHAFTKQRANDL